jgi:predicted HTH domain antitoxin
MEALRREGVPVKQSVTISVPVPEEILLSLRVETSEFASQMKTLTALKLCENHKLSIGQSAALAGMNEADFIKILGQNRISIFGSASEIAEDFHNA